MPGHIRNNHLKKLLKWTALAIGTLVLGVVLFLGGMGLHDGPLGIFSGGPFKTGTPSPTPNDWSFLKDRSTIEFQTMSPAQSRTVYVASHDQRLFIVSSYMTTSYGAIWKQWPHFLEVDDRVILRVDGKLYQQRLQRIMSGPDVIPVLSEFSRKYGGGESMREQELASGYTWLYQVVLP